MSDLSMEARLKAAEEWARTMEHERDYEQQVVSEDLRQRLAESERVRRQLAEALLMTTRWGDDALEALRAEALAASDALDAGGGGAETRVVVGCSCGMVYPQPSPTLRCNCGTVVALQNEECGKELMAEQRVRRQLADVVRKWVPDSDCRCSMHSPVWTALAASDALNRKERE